jgi:hypothetical protein
MKRNCFSIQKISCNNPCNRKEEIKTQSIEKNRFKLAMCQWESSKKNKVKNLATHQQPKTNKPKKMTCNMLIAKLIEIINNNNN